jgi:hypothetical protein
VQYPAVEKSIDPGLAKTLTAEPHSELISAGETGVESVVQVPAGGEYLPVTSPTFLTKES